MDLILANILRGLVTYSVGIYIILGIAIVIYLSKLISGMAAWQKAVFGLERRIAQRKLITAVTGVTLLVFLLVGQFILTTVIGPQMPLPLAAGQSNVEDTEDFQDLDGDNDANSPESDLIEIGEQGTLQSLCEEEILEITNPEDGERVSGTVEIIGTVNVNDFGSFKYEYATLAAENWITIAADNQLKLDEQIGLWYTSALDPGWYLLRLVPLNNRGEELTPCIISLEVIFEE